MIWVRDTTVDAMLRTVVNLFCNDRHKPTSYTFCREQSIDYDYTGDWWSMHPCNNKVSVSHIQYQNLFQRPTLHLSAIVIWTASEFTSKKHRNSNLAWTGWHNGMLADHSWSDLETHVIRQRRIQHASTLCRRRRIRRRSLSLLICHGLWWSLGLSNLGLSQITN